MKFRTRYWPSAYCNKGESLLEWKNSWVTSLVAGQPSFLQRLWPIFVVNIYFYCCCCVLTTQSSVQAHSAGTLCSEIFWILLMFYLMFWSVHNSLGIFILWGIKIGQNFQVLLIDWCKSCHGKKIIQEPAICTCAGSVSLAVCICTGCMRVRCLYSCWCDEN